MPSFVDMPSYDLAPPSPSTFLIFALAIGFLFCLTIKRFIQFPLGKSHNPGLPLPPGPRGLPLLGNVFDLTANYPWLKAAQWAEEYGEIVHVNAVGQHLIYLNTYEVASDLLELRSSKYSDRAVTEMARLSGATDYMFSRMPYGETWRTSRRMFHQEFNSNTSVNFLDTQSKRCGMMLQQMSRDPAHFESHIKHYTAGIILETVYGIQVQSNDDPYVRSVEAAMSGLETLAVAAYAVDLFPFLRYLPAWFPGARFKRQAAMWRQCSEKSVVLPFQVAREQMKLDGESKTNMITRGIDKLNAKSDEAERQRLEDCLQLAGGVALFGGYETSSSTILVFIYLMVIHPEVQDKLQAELNAVVGRGRLPDFSDREHLPYVNAVCKEVLRWHPINPLGTHHRAIKDDEYKGMSIPEGGLLMPNAWAMARDKNVYGDDAHLFRPERFLESELRDPARFVFGFGRRICPGRYLADNNIFIAIASLIHLFKIGKAVDGSGKEITPEAHWTTGLIVHLEPYPCSIVPRFEGTESLLKASDM